MTERIDYQKRQVLRAVAAGIAVVGTGVGAGCAVRDHDEPPKAGRDYRAISPAGAPVRGGQIEVTEFFWYGCPFCRKFAAELKRWHAQNEGSVVLRIEHPAPNKGWLPHARMHYALQSLGVADQLGAELFAAMQGSQFMVETRDEVANLVEGLGVERSRFLGAFDQAETSTQVDNANRLSKVVGLDGVPALSVNGRWYTSSAMADGVNNLLWVLNHLVALERARA